MPWTPSQCGLDPACARAADTAIFVDVDGVLNVGAWDEGGPLVLNDAGIEDAMKLWGKHQKHPMRDTIERLVSLARREIGHGEGATYAKLASAGEAEFSEVLVGRLAELIKAAGDRRMVVLSSRWKGHRARVLRLESSIAAHLKKPFCFDASTQKDRRTNPEGRLESIGDFLAGLCEWRGGNGSTGALRALVLEDFHITPFGSWSCGGVPICSVSAAEQYLRKRAPVSLHSNGEVSVTLVHTYDEWRTPGGLLVQVGCGLTMQHFCQAARIFGEGCDYCSGQANAETSATQRSLQPPTDTGKETNTRKRPNPCENSASGDVQPTAKVQKTDSKCDTAEQQQEPRRAQRLDFPAALSTVAP